jgi:hypothetical protein
VHPKIFRFFINWFQFFNSSLKFSFKSTSSLLVHIIVRVVNSRLDDFRYQAFDHCAESLWNWLYLKYQKRVEIHFKIGSWVINKKKNNVENIMVLLNILNVYLNIRYLLTSVSISWNRHFKNNYLSPIKHCIKHSYRHNTCYMSFDRTPIHTATINNTINFIQYSFWSILWGV